MSAVAGRFPGSTGPMAEQVRALAWQATPVGPIETWPGALRNAVNLILASPKACTWSGAMT